MYGSKFTEIAQQKSQNKRLILRKGRSLLFIIFFAFLFFDILLIAEYKSRGVKAVGYQMMEKVSSILQSGTDFVSSIWEGELKRDGNFTSALLVGIDTRDVKFTGEEFISTDPEGQAGTRNTDTIIQLVYDHAHDNVFMISIPRDMGIDVDKECLEFHGSIHWVYDKGQSAACPGGGVQTLIETVEGITGIQIQYYGFISFDVFVDIINAVGDINQDGERGIWLDIPEPVYELYPLGDYGWESIYFPEGRQFLTAERALKFARSRKASSDFDRAKRQQMVIEAVKERVISSHTLINPKKVYSLFKIFKDKALLSDLSLDEIRAGLTIAQSLEEIDTFNIVLDPEFGGHEVYINKQPHDRLTAQYYMIPTHWKECPGDEFCRVKEFLQEIMTYPHVYEEQSRVFVYARSYNSSWQVDFDNALYDSLKNNGLPITMQESKYIANINDPDDIIIYDFTDGGKLHTLEALANELSVMPQDGSKNSSIRINNEDIAIIVKGR